MGTRPEAIKLAPLSKALSDRDLEPLIVATGQHPSLDLVEHGFQSRSVLQLGCRGVADPHQHVRSVAATLLPLLHSPPELLVVQGDTSSALGAALAGRMSGVPVAHVEAGLRSHDPAMPWPEEEYRTAIDAVAGLLFAPTELAATNLRQERVAGAIFVTGNTGIDALLAKLDRLPSRTLHEPGTPRILVTCHRRENWNERLEGIAGALRQVVGSGAARVEMLLPPNRHVAERMRTLLGGCAGTDILEPCGHAELIDRMRSCTLMLSDSGGVQEEAPAMGVPLLVLRDKTERPEAIATGNMRLIGTDPRRIVEEVSSLLADHARRAAMCVPVFPYGDGSASRRISAIIEERLTAQPPPAARPLRSGSVQRSSHSGHG